MPGHGQQSEDLGSEVLKLSLEKLPMVTAEILGSTVKSEIHWIEDLDQSKKEPAGIGWEGSS